MNPVAGRDRQGSGVYVRIGLRAGRHRQPEDIALKFSQWPSFRRRRGIGEALDPLFNQNLFTGRIVKVDPQCDGEIGRTQVERRIMGDIDIVAIAIENKTLTDKAGAECSIILKNTIMASDNITGISISRPPPCPTLKGRIAAVRRRDLQNRYGRIKWLKQ